MGNRETGVLEKRFTLPGKSVGLRKTDENRLKITYIRFPRESDNLLHIFFKNGSFNRPVSYGYNYRNKMRSSGINEAKNLYPEIEKELFIREEGDRALLDLKTKKPDLDFDKMRKRYKTEVARNPANPWNLFFLGLTEFMDGNKKKAGRIFDRVLNEYDNIPYYEHAWLGARFSRLGLIERARLEYEKTVEEFHEEVAYNFEYAPLIDVLINFPGQRTGARHFRAGNIDWGLKSQEYRRKIFSFTDNEEIIDRVLLEWDKKKGMKTSKTESRIKKMGNMKILRGSNLEIEMDLSIYLSLALMILTGILIIYYLLQIREGNTSFVRSLKLNLSLTVVIILYLIAASCFYITGMKQRSWNVQPLAHADSMGHSKWVEQLEDNLSEGYTAAFPAAFSNQLHGNDKRAGELYSKLKNHPGALINRGVMEYKKGNTKKARELFEKAQSLDKSSVPAFYNLWFLKGKDSLLDKARSLDKEAVNNQLNYRPDSLMLTAPTPKEISDAFYTPFNFVDYAAAVIHPVLFMDITGLKYYNLPHREILESILPLTVLLIFTAASLLFFYIRRKKNIKKILPRSAFFNILYLVSVLLITAGILLDSRKPLFLPLGLSFGTLTLVASGISYLSEKRKRILEIFLPGSYFLRKGRVVKGIIFLFVFLITFLPALYFCIGPLHCEPEPGLGISGLLPYSGIHSSFPVNTVFDGSQPQVLTSKWDAFWAYPYSEIFWYPVFAGFVLVVILHIYFYVGDIKDLKNSGEL